MAQWQMGKWTMALAIAVALAGCAAPQHPQHPQQAAEPAQSWAQAGQDCAPPSISLSDRMELLQRELEPLGLQARIAGCTTPPQPAQGVQALLIDAWVLDGRKARAVVRGPLADGEPLDLGLMPTGAKALSEEAVSPDVRFNRRWWHERLHAYGLSAVAGQVRVFVPTP